MDWGDSSLESMLCIWGFVLVAPGTEALAQGRATLGCCLVRGPGGRREHGTLEGRPGRRGKSPGRRPGALGPAPGTGTRKEAGDVAVLYYS